MLGLKRHGIQRAFHTASVRSSHGRSAGNNLRVIEQADAGTYIGKPAGFPHIEIHGGSAAEAEGKFRRAALDCKASGVLVLECHFVKLVKVDGSATGDGPAPTSGTETHVARHADNRAEPGGGSLAGRAPDSRFQSESGFATKQDARAERLPCPATLLRRLYRSHLQAPCAPLQEVGLLSRGQWAGDAAFNAGRASSARAGAWP